MLMVDTELRPSAIHGLGVFLLEPVRKGQLIWRFDSRLDQVFGEDNLRSLPEITQRFLRNYATWNSTNRLWVLCGDNGRYFNHSDLPNTISSGPAFGTDIAAWDLPTGTELTSDYRVICDDVRLNACSFISAASVTA